MSLNFRISVAEAREFRKTLPLFVVSSTCSTGTNYEIVAKPPNKGCGSLFRIVNLPTYLQQMKGFYLGLKYFIQVSVNDTNDFKYLQLNSNNSYTAVDAINENCFGVIFYDDCGHWNSAISLGKCDESTSCNKNSGGQQAGKRGLRFLNYYPQNLKGCEKFNAAIFRRDDYCEKERLVFSITECSSINNCTICGPDSCAVNATCVNGNCSTPSSGGISFSLRATNLSDCPLILTYDFVDKGKCCGANAKGNIKLRMRAVGINGIAATDNDPYNPRLQLYYSDGPFEVGKISTVFVLQDSTKKYLSNPVNGQDRKGPYTEYCLDKSPSCHALAFKPRHNGNWNTYSFTQKDFLYLQLPENSKVAYECGEFCEEKGSKRKTREEKKENNNDDSIALPSLGTHSFKIPLDLSNQVIEEMVMNSLVSKEKGGRNVGYLSESESSQSDDSSNIIFIDSGSRTSRTSRTLGSQRTQTSKTSKTSQIEQDCSSSSSSSSSSSKENECVSSSCSSSATSSSKDKDNCVEIGLWSNVSKDGTSVVPSNPMPTPIPGTNPLTPLIPNLNPIPTPTPTPTPATTNWWWVWIVVGVILIIILSIVGIYLYRQRANVLIAANSGTTTTITKTTLPLGSAKTTFVNPTSISTFTPPTPTVCPYPTPLTKDNVCATPPTYGTSVSPTKRVQFANPISTSTPAPASTAVTNTTMNRPCPPGQSIVTTTTYPDGTTSVVRN